MTKDELFEIFDKYDTYEFREEGESIHGIKWADLNGLADELVKLFAKPVVVGRSEQLFCNCGFNSSTFQLETGEICCCNCEKEIAK